MAQVPEVNFKELDALLGNIKKASATDPKLAEYTGQLSTLVQQYDLVRVYISGTQNIIPELKRLLLISNYDVVAAVALIILRMAFNGSVAAIMENENMVRELVDVIDSDNYKNATDPKLVNAHESCIFALGNMCVIKSCAVKSMLYGSVPILINLLYRYIKNIKSSDRVSAIVMTLAIQTYSSTVRNFVYQVLFQQQESLKGLTELCTSESLYIAFHAATCISFFLLNEKIISVLVHSCKALENLRIFVKRAPNEPQLASRKFFIDIDELKEGYLALFESQYIEVVNLLLWIFARYTYGDKEISYHSSITPQWITTYYLQQIRMYCNHTNKRARELSRLILKNIGDTEFLTANEDIVAWLKSIEIEETPKVPEILVSNYITLDLLLHSKISIDDIKSMLCRLNFKEGTNFRILLAISEARQNIENAKLEALNFAHEIEANEQAAANRKIESKESEQNTKKEKNIKKKIFISYCWADKAKVKRLQDVLIANNFDCWMDEGKMKGGAQLFAAIDQGITDAQVMLSCCSNSYGASENCKREVNLAVDRRKLIIPVIISHCDPWPPIGTMGPLLTGKIFVDLSTNEKFDSTIDQLLIAINQSL
jgi:hypothetical protein